MFMPEPDFSSKNDVLLRFSAVNFVQNCIISGNTLSEALSDAASRLWGNPPSFYSIVTLRRWHRRFKEVGLASLRRKLRNDNGASRCISPDVQQSFLRLKRDSPSMPVMKIAHRLEEDGVLEHGTISRATLYRFSSNNGFYRNTKTPEITEKFMSSHSPQAWLLRVMQGALQTNDLCKQLAPRLGVDVVCRLHRIVLTKPLRKRNKSIAVLGHFNGIAKCEIASFLHIGRKTVGRYVAKFLSSDIDGLLAHERKIGRKVTDKKYIDMLFSILHAPPSDYGFNRTTWRETDLKEVMCRKGFPISLNSMNRIIRDSGYTFYKARKRLTSDDPAYKEKLEKITGILSSLGENEKFFSIDEYGPFSVRSVGGRHLAPQGKPRSIPQHQKSKGSLICTGALELSTNQITYFFSDKKNTDEMIKLLEILLKEYVGQDRLYLSWDAASWHISKNLNKTVATINDEVRNSSRPPPIVELAPLPASAQFLNVIESVFSGMARAVIHNSDYASVKDCMAAIDRHFKERNEWFKANPKRAGKKIWGKEIVEAVFVESNNCKNKHYR
jgi:transposase